MPGKSMAGPGMPPESRHSGKNGQFRALPRAGQGDSAVHAGLSEHFAIENICRSVPLRGIYS